MISSLSHSIDGGFPRGGIWRWIVRTSVEAVVPDAAVEKIDFSFSRRGRFDAVESDF